MKNKVPITIIPDSTAAYIMNQVRLTPVLNTYIVILTIYQVDMVLVGAEAVVENGGVINKVIAALTVKTQLTINIIKILRIIEVIFLWFEKRFP